MFKKILFSMVLTAVFQTGFSQSIMFGLGGTYGTEIKQFAPNGRIYFGLNEQICFGPEYSYFPTISHEGKDLQLSEYGFVLHYIFEIREKVGIYPLIGFNYSVEKESHNEELIKNKAFGASFGLGFHLALNNWMPFAEYKFITGDLSQSTFSVGLIYNLHLSEHSQSKIEHE